MATQLNPATKAQGESVRPSSAGEKVVVANKLPMAIRMRNFKPHEVPYQQRDGAVRMVKEFVPEQTSIVLNGAAPPRVGMPSYRILQSGYALTEGVDKASFDDWHEANKDQGFIVNKLIFAAKSVEEAEAIAKENAGRVTSMEKLVPDRDDRLRRMSPAFKIETAEK